LDNETKAVDNETKSVLLEEARTWIGTPWRHRVALRGWGVDCVQFVISCGKAAGAVPDDYEPPHYHRDHASHNATSILIPELEKFCTRLPSIDDVKPGDILAFQFGLCANHAALCSGPGLIIHAPIHRRVREERLDGIVRLRRRVMDPSSCFHSAWRFTKGAR
jgi:cell wall-associated NlpC family hydrolase